MGKKSLCCEQARQVLFKSALSKAIQVTVLVGVGSPRLSIAVGDVLKSVAIVEFTELNTRVKMFVPSAMVGGNAQMLSSRGRGSGSALQNGMLSLLKVRWVSPRFEVSL